MRTLPRYLPAIDLRSRLAGLSSTNIELAKDSVAAGLGLSGWQQLIPMPSARHALAAFLSDLAQRERPRRVLLSAQICPIVPLVLVRHGFRPVFVDVERAVPVPGPDQLVAAAREGRGAESVTFALVAPFYGYIPIYIDRLVEVLPGIPVVLDMAQGALLAASMPGLMARAEAAIYSFSIGKGFDMRGGLLGLRRRTLDVKAGGAGPTFSPLASLPAAVALRAAVNLRLYGLLSRLVDREIEIDKRSPPASAARLRVAAPSGILVAASCRLRTLAAEVELARQRALELYALPAVQHHCREAASLADRTQMHLRQLVRLLEPDRRAHVLAALRADGIEAMPAGELLPEAYLDRKDYIIAAASEGFPNAKRFLADAIRLPFLGRMDEESFQRVQRSLVQALQ